jgi:hypothetical protein
LFDEWAARLARGEHPDPREYLERAGEGNEELSRLMEVFLRAAPRAEPDEETVDLVRAWIAGASPLAELRARRGVRRDDVVAAVMTEFALAEEKRPTVKRYYHRLEAGLLDAGRLSEPLADLLGRTLGVSRDMLLAWRPRSLPAAPAFREAGAHDLTVEPKTAREAGPDDPEVQALFLGDRPH